MIESMKSYVNTEGVNLGSGSIKQFLIFSVFLKMMWKTPKKVSGE